MCWPLQIFLLHFWNQEPSKRIFPLRKVYVRKKIFLTENNSFLLLRRLESKKDRNMFLINVFN
ncbi:hypothetical protein O3M35_003337 [Rhynocoris fuscipes]|uniref:Uncharacterized protein n=1 Tax=Rhynocoris fuscipes TaxID=488301 RepID=A0AAW1CR89_9HEMI